LLDGPRALRLRPWNDDERPGPEPSRSSSARSWEGRHAGEGPRTSLPDLDELPRLALIEELRIGSVDDPDTGFSEVDRHVEVTAGDTVWIMERQDLTIRAYGPDGELVRRMGGRGDGPGELGFPGAWGIQNDTVWVIGFERIGSSKGLSRREAR
jgi:hypothetical protein